MVDVVEFELQPGERDLILKHAFPHEEIVRRLKMGIHAKTGLIYRFPPDIFEDLVDCVAAEANHATTRKLEREFDALYEKLAALSDDHLAAEPKEAEEKEEFLAQFPPHIREAVRGILDDPRFTTLDQVNAALDAVMQMHNQAPLAEFAGLSPEQVYRLTRGKWDDPEESFYIREDLSHAELAEVSIYRNAMILLRGLGDEGVAATKGGNLNTEFVRKMAEEMVYDGIRKEIAMSRRLFEEDFRLLNQLRYVLTYMGLIRKYKGKFVRTKKAAKYMQEQHAGEFYAQLLRVNFQKFDIGFPFYPDEFYPLQWALPFAVYVLDRFCRDWQPVEKAASNVLLPTVVPYIDETRYFLTPKCIGETYFLRPLRDFDLLEYRDRDGVRYMHDVRTTPLFERVFKLEL